MIEERANEYYDARLELEVIICDYVTENGRSSTIEVLNVKVGASVYIITGYHERRRMSCALDDRSVYRVHKDGSRGTRHLTSPAHYTAVAGGSLRD